MSRSAKEYQNSIPHRTYTITCLICGREFVGTWKQLKHKKTCSKKCFHKLCQQNSLSLPLLSEEAYRIIGKKTKNHPKTGHFLTNKGAKEYSLKSPTGEMFICRNLAHFILHNMELFSEIFGGIEYVRFTAVRAALTALAPWRQEARESKSWNGWTWHDDSAGYRPMRRVIFSLGSNIEPCRTWIDKAAEALAALPDARDVRRSPLYETAPNDDVPEMFRNLPFLNGIVTLETRTHPLELLKVTQAIENSLGRTHDGVHGSPRTIDIDIIAIDNVRVARPELLVPHPRAMTRRFVLQPLADLLPDFRFPGQTQSVSDLLRELDTPRP